MREELNALQAERLEQERIRQEEALVFKIFRKDMNRRKKWLVS
jgi:hypothetical protein